MPNVTRCQGNMPAAVGTRFDHLENKLDKLLNLQTVTCSSQNMQITWITSINTYRDFTSFFWFIFCFLYIYLFYLSTAFPQIMARAFIYHNRSRAPGLYLRQSCIRDRPLFQRPPDKYNLSYKSLLQRVLFLYSLIISILF